MAPEALVGGRQGSGDIYYHIVKEFREGNVGTTLPVKSNLFIPSEILLGIMMFMCKKNDINIHALPDPSAELIQDVLDGKENLSITMSFLREICISPNIPEEFYKNLFRETTKIDASEPPWLSILFNKLREFYNSGVSVKTDLCDKYVTFFESYNRYCSSKFGDRQGNICLMRFFNSSRVKRLNTSLSSYSSELQKQRGDDTIPLEGQSAPATAPFGRNMLVINIPISLGYYPLSLTSISDTDKDENEYLLPPEMHAKNIEQIAENKLVQISRNGKIGEKMFVTTLSVGTFIETQLGGGGYKRNKNKRKKTKRRKTKKRNNTRKKRKKTRRRR